MGGALGGPYTLLLGPTYVVTYTGNFNILSREKDRDEEVSKTVPKRRPEKIEK